MIGEGEFKCEECKEIFDNQERDVPDASLCEYCADRIREEEALLHLTLGRDK